ncbi:unnamed protein product [Gordionus sp. m RMFG-2023]
MNIDEKDTCKKALLNLIDDTSKVSTYLDEVIGFVKTNLTQYEKGLDILQTKNLIFLDYISNLTYILHKKISGKTIKDDKSVKQLIESRVFLEKITMMERKLKETIQKQLKMTQSFENLNVTENMPSILTLRPNIANMIDDDADEASEIDSSNETAHNGVSISQPDSFPISKSREQGSDQKYRPPKIMSVPYQDGIVGSKFRQTISDDDSYDRSDDSDAGDYPKKTRKLKNGDESNFERNQMATSIDFNNEMLPSKLSKRQKIVAKSKKRALRSGLLDELRQQYGDRPEEYKERPDFARKMIQKEMDDRNRYEEDYMVRLNLTKKDKHKMKLLRNTSGALNDITDFKDYRDLMVEAAEEENTKAKSKRRNVKFVKKTKKWTKSKGRKKKF